MTAPATIPIFIMTSTNNGISFSSHECVRQSPKLSGNLICRNALRLKLRRKLAQPLKRLFLAFFPRGSRFAPIQHRRTPAPLQFEPAFVLEDSVSLGHRVEVDCEIDCQLPHCRDLITGPQCAVDEEVPHGVRYLAVDGNRGVKVDCDNRCHCLLSILNIQYMSRNAVGLLFEVLTLLRYH